MKSSIHILNELNRLKIAHESSKVNSTTKLQPSEKEQVALIAKSCSNKLVAVEIRKEVQKFVFNETMKIHKLKRALEETNSVNSQNNSNNASPPRTAPAQTGSPFLHSGTHHRASFHNYIPTGENRPTTAGFANLLKDTSAPVEVFEDNIHHQIKQQTKNAKNVFNAMVTNFKQGTLVQFTAKNTTQEVDVTQFVPPPVISSLQTNLKFDDLKKKDCMALIIDPSVNTHGHKVTLRIRYKRQISFSSEEDCMKEYSFHANGNYFGVELCDEASLKDYTASRNTPLSSSFISQPMTPEFSFGRQTSNRSIDSDNSRPENTSPIMDNANASEGVISLPGWGIRPPILINATKCSIEIVLEDSSSQLDPALMFELSKLRLYAITCLSMKSGLKKFSDFCDSHFQSASANLLIPGGVSALNIAALHGNLEAVAQLIATGANINLRNKGSRYNTALHEAVIGGFKDVAQYLLENGANQLLKDDAGNTPLHLACKLNDIAIARILINSPNGKRALIALDNNDQKPIDACTTNFMKIRIEGAMRKFKIFVKPRVSILDR